MGSPVSLLAIWIAVLLVCALSYAPYPGPEWKRTLFPLQSGQQIGLDFLENVLVTSIVVLLAMLDVFLVLPPIRMEGCFSTYLVAP